MENGNSYLLSWLTFGILIKTNGIQLYHTVSGVVAQAAIYVASHLVSYLYSYPMISHMPSYTHIRSYVPTIAN